MLEYCSPEHGRFLAVSYRDLLARYYDTTQPWQYLNLCCLPQVQLSFGGKAQVRGDQWCYNERQQRLLRNPGRSCLGYLSSHEPVYAQHYRYLPLRQPFYVAALGRWAYFSNGYTYLATDFNLYHVTTEWRGGRGYVHRAEIQQLTIHGQICWVGDRSYCMANGTWRTLDGKPLGLGEYTQCYYNGATAVGIRRDGHYYLAPLDTGPGALITFRMKGNYSYLIGTLRRARARSCRLLVRQSRVNSRDSSSVIVDDIDLVGKSSDQWLINVPISTGQVATNQAGKCQGFDVLALWRLEVSN
jgi:hypothetical protein